MWERDETGHGSLALFFHFSRRVSSLFVSFPAHYVHPLPLPFPVGSAKGRSDEGKEKGTYEWWILLWILWVSFVIFIIKSIINPPTK